MAPNKQQRKAVRPEFAPASSRRQPARALSRKLLPRLVQDDAESTITAGSHGDEPSAESKAPLPPEDRAG
jgi:hypothetical protein